MIPTAYELKRLVARHRHRFWCADSFAGLPTAPVYLFHDQEAFDSDPVDMVARHLSAGPLRLPHREVLFEVTNRGPDVTALVAFLQRTDQGALAGCLFMRDRRAKVGWTDALCIAEFLATGGVRCRAHYQTTNDEAKVYVEVLVWMTWRSLAILQHAAEVRENRVALPQRSRMSARGVSGWVYRVVDIDPQRIEAARRSATGTHASPRWHIRRGHWRTLPGGRTTFVRECEVGDAARGGIVKDYRVQTEARA